MGVDLESPARSSDSLALSRRFYSPAEAHWVAGAGPAESRQRFLRLWVRKEAILKATSEGLPAVSRCARPRADAPHDHPGDRGEPSSWTVADVDVAVHPSAAVALAGEVCEPRVLSLADLDGSGRLRRDD